MRNGVIVKGVGGLYYARGEDGEVSVLRAKGRFRREGVTPLVGDRVVYEPGHGEEHGWVDTILPRDNELTRPPVANIRYVMIVVAPVPQPDWLLVDTLLAMAAARGIRPALLANKCDLSRALFQTLSEDYRGLEAPLLPVSAVTGEGLDALRDLMTQGLCCFAGQSGVGKSTLLSAATGLTLRSGAISERSERGKHTTRHTELLTHGPYQVLDTPGFSLLELWDGLEPVLLKDYYPEFAAYEGQCRFSPCYHFSEPGCAALQAVKAGELSERRVERYHALLQKAQKAWRERYE